MPSKDAGEDIAFFLYLVPIVASIAYGVYEWYSVAITASMPPLAYLIVAKSQYLFLISLLAVCFAIIFEIRSTNLQEREAVVRANSIRLQWLAIITIIVSLAAAISAGNYNISNGLVIFVQGRYPIIYAFFLVGISLLLTPKQIVGNARVSSLPEILGMLLLVASPVIFYAGVKTSIPFAESAIGGVVVAIIGLVLLLGIASLMSKKPKPVEASQKQV